MDDIIISNRTLYPRRSAWATMVAAGQLGDLDPSELVARMGSFSESINARMIDVGDNYDANHDDLVRNSFPRCRDGIDQRLLTTDTEQLAVFRNQLRYLHLSWNRWYLDLLDAYGRILDSLTGDIESYPGDNGIEQPPANPQS